MLHRGFTTVRDVGGADWGIARAVAEGRVEGPEIIYGGKALTATGGHGDYRSAGQYYEDQSYWVPRISRLADGVDELRLAVSDEVRKGAHHIKIMANGGVASPTDRITSDQYSEARDRSRGRRGRHGRPLRLLAHLYGELDQAGVAQRRALDRARQFGRPGSDRANEKHRRLPRSDADHVQGAGRRRCRGRTATGSRAARSAQWRSAAWRWSSRRTAPACRWRMAAI